MHKEHTDSFVSYVDSPSNSIRFCIFMFKLSISGQILPAHPVV